MQGCTAVVLGLAARNATIEENRVFAKILIHGLNGNGDFGPLLEVLRRAIHGDDLIGVFVIRLGRIISPRITLDWMLLSRNKSPGWWIRQRSFERAVSSQPILFILGVISSMNCKSEQFLAPCSRGIEAEEDHVGTANCVHRYSAFFLPYTHG